MDEVVGKGVGQGGGLDANAQSKHGFVKASSVVGAPSQLQVDEIGGIPSDAPQSIRESKHALVYYDWCRANWSILAMEQQAKEQFGEGISNETFRKFKNILKLRGEVLTNYKSSLLKGVESPHLNVIQEMRNVIALHFKRIADIYEKEKTMQNSMGSVPYISGALQEEQNALSRDLAVLFQMEQKEKEFNLHRNVKLGIVDDEEIIDIEASNVPSEIEVKRKVSAYTAEQAHAMKMALMWAQKVYLLELIDNSDVVTVEDYGEAILVFSVKSGDPVKVEEFIKLQYHEYWFGMSQEIRVLEQVWVRLC